VANLDYDLELLSHLPDPDAWVVLRGEGFSEKLIKDEAVLDIYQWQHEHLKKHGVPATANVLDDEFEIEFTEPQTSIGDLIDRLRVRYMEDQGREALKRIGMQYQEDKMLLPKLLIKQGRELSELLSRRGETFRSGDFDRLWDGYLLEKEAGPGPSLGDPVLDDFFGGQRGITVFLGAPKAGKSWMMVKALIENVRNGRYPFLYPLELPAEETTRRVLHMAADVPWWKYIRQALGKAEEDALREAEEELAGLGAYTIAQPPEGERSIDDLVGKAQDAGADCVLVDQLQYVEYDGKPLGDWGETGKFWAVLSRARTLSKETPIVFAHPFNRSVRGMDEMPDAEQAKNSSAVHETASLVLGIWASKEMRLSNKLQVGTLAARNHAHLKWEADIDMSKGCSIKITNVVEDE